MQRGTAGFVGGVIGGIIKLVIDQITLAINISAVDTIGTFSRLFSMPSVLCWFVYIIATGLLGLVIVKIIPRSYENNFFTAGVILGTVVWGLMNIIFAVSGVVNPTWSMGLGSFVFNLISHMVLGVTIFYFSNRAQETVTK